MQPNQEVRILAQIQMKSRIFNWINAEFYLCTYKAAIQELRIYVTQIKFELQSHMPATIQCIHSGSHSKEKGILHICSTQCPIAWVRVAT